MRAPKEQLSITELRTIHALAQNDFVVTDAALDLGLLSGSVSSVISRLLGRMKRPEKLLNVALKGEEGVGGKRVLGLSEEGKLLYKTMIEPLVLSYEALLEELELGEEN